MSYVDELQTLIRGHLDRCETFLDGAEKEGPGLIRQFVNFELKTVVPVPFARDEISDRIIGYFTEAIGKAREGIEQQREMNRNLGSPDTLRLTADVIKEKISGAVDTLDMSKSDLDGMIAWDDGAASRKYEFAYDDQPDQVARIPSTASTLHDVLRSLANGIEDYYLQLLAAVISFVAAVMGAIGSILSLVGGALTAVTGIGAVLGLIGAGLGAITSILGAIGSVIAVYLVFQTLAHSVNDNLDALSTTTMTWEVPKFVTVD